MTGISVNLFLHYRDAFGAETERVVTAHELHGYAAAAIFVPVLIVGHCHLRDDIRSFRVDRALSIADPRTGELVDDLMDYVYARVPRGPQEARKSRRPKKKESAAAGVAWLFLIGIAIAYCQSRHDGAPTDTTGQATSGEADSTQSPTQAEAAAPTAPAPATDGSPAPSDVPTIAPEAPSAPSAPPAAAAAEPVGPERATIPPSAEEAPAPQAADMPAADIDSAYSPRLGQQAVACIQREARAVLATGIAPGGCYFVASGSRWRLLEVQAGLWRMVPADARPTVALWFDPHQMHEAGLPLAPRYVAPPIHIAPQPFQPPLAPALPAAPAQTSPAPARGRQGGRAGQ